MKIFALRDTIFSEEGLPKLKPLLPFRKPYDRRHRDENNILIFNDGIMYSGSVLPKKLDKFLEQVKQIEDIPCEFQKDFTSIKLEETLKVLQRPGYNIGGTLTMVGNDLRFYRVIHVDAKIKAKIPTLWLLNQEVVDIISPYVTKPGIRTDFEMIGNYLVPKRKMNSLYGDRIERLPLGDMDFYWSEEKGQWVYGIDYSYLDD